MSTRVFGWTIGLAFLAIAGTLHAQERPAAQFDRWDKDGDGRVSREEMPQGLRNNFDRIDTDGDGYLSREEDAAVRRRLAQRNAGRAGQRPAGQRQRPGGQARQRPAGQGVPGVEVRRNIAYAGTDNPRQMLDVFLPEARKSDKPLPMVVWIHGGGWRAGSKDGALGRMRHLLATGEYAGAAINYRLTNESQWPDQIHDCKAAIRWLRANAKDLGVDPDRIAIWGSSAGGHLVAVLGTSGDVEAIEGDLGPHADVSSRVACVVDYYGPTDFLRMNDFKGSINHDAANSPESLLLGGAVQESEEAARSASPLTYVSEDDPPMLLVHGDKDPVVPFDQSIRLEKALREAGRDVTLITVEGAGHGGFKNPEILDRVSAFLDKHLRGQDVEVEGGTIPNEAPTP